MAVENKDDKTYAEDLAKQSSQLSYVPSQTVADAQTELQEVSNGKPQEYTGENADQLQGLYDNIINQSPYSYDPTKDTAFQQYRQNYEALTRQGSQAAQDTTKAMNGGYGSSWSSQAAGQQYGVGIEATNDVLPQYEQNAYAKYQSDENLKEAQLNTALSKEQMNYRLWSDTYKRWYDDRAYAAGRADRASEKDYSIFSDNAQNALTMLGYGREDAETVRANAGDFALSLLKKGVMPIDAVLESAGISKEDALNYAKENGYK